MIYTYYILTLHAHCLPLSVYCSCINILVLCYKNIIVIIIIIMNGRYSSDE